MEISRLEGEGTITKKGIRAKRPISPYRIIFNSKDIPKWLAKVGSIEKATDIIKMDARNTIKLMLKYGKDK